MRIVLPIVFILLSLITKAQPQTITDPVKWSYSYEKINEKEGFLVIKAVIDDKWHIYSQSQSSDGPIATSFVYTPAKDYDLIGKTEEPAAEKVYSEVFGTEVISFSKEVIFKQKIKRNNVKEFAVTAEVEYMSCNDNTCLPPKTLKISVLVP